MAIYRQVHTSFWQDYFVLLLTPEKKYFYLYLLTNSKTKQCGIYELPMKVIELETGYNSETIDKLLNEFISFGKIKYNRQTKEICIVNWFKYNPATSPKIRICVEKELRNVKDRALIGYTGYPMQGVSQQEQEQEQEQEQKEECISVALQETLQDQIQNLWIRTIGRNPKQPEFEETEKLLQKYGPDKVYDTFKRAALRNIKSLQYLLDNVDADFNLLTYTQKNNNAVGETKTAAHQYID